MSSSHRFVRIVPAAIILLATSLATAGPTAPECKQDGHTLICHAHQGKTAFKFNCVDGSAVPGHLRHGDHIPETYYPDADGDGFGDRDASAVIECVQPPGTVLDNTDCDDTNPDTFPGAPEICDRLDNDCNLLVDDGVCGKIVFVSSSTHLADFGGLAVADSICQGLADAVPLGGTYLAWLSDSSSSPSTRFDTGFVSDYVLTDGTVIASGWTDLTDGNMTEDLNIDENGNVVPEHGVWTGTLPDGTPASIGNFCVDWSSRSNANNSTFGWETRASGDWTHEGQGNCSSGGLGINVPRLYCFQQ